jgi:hypothetical protein
VRFDFGLTTVSSCLWIWLDTVRDQPRANLAHVNQFFAFLLADVERRNAARVFDKPDDWEFPFCTALIFSHASFRSERYGASARFKMIPSHFNLAACSNILAPSPMRCSEDRPRRPSG